MLRALRRINTKRKETPSKGKEKQKNQIHEILNINLVKQILLKRALLHSLLHTAASLMFPHTHSLVLALAVV